MLTAALAFTAGSFAAAGAVLLLPYGWARRAPQGAGLVRALAVAGDRLAPRGAAAAGGCLPPRGDAAGGRLPLRKAAAPRDLAGRIAAAGSPAGLGVRELLAAKLAAAIAAGAFGLVLASIAPGRLGALSALAAPAVGFLGPDLWLARRAADRAHRARRELPALLDLLRVTVAAGASLPEALRTVGERAASGALAREWRAVGRQVSLGVPLGSALEHMAERVPLPEVRALVGALDRARRHGAPLGDTLEAQARDARAARARRIREDAARAGPKIQLVVALLLVPSVLLLVAAAFVAALVGQGGEVVPL